MSYVLLIINVVEDVVSQNTYAANFVMAEIKIESVAGNADQTIPPNSIMMIVLIAGNLCTLEPVRVLIPLVPTFSP